MTAGRPTKPTFLKLVTGTARKSRVNAAEPKPPAGTPRLPEHLTSYARLAWLRFAPLVERMGVLTHQDGPALERLCECYAEIRMLSDAITADGMLIRPLLTNKDGVPARGDGDELLYGKPVLHPAVAARADADRRFSTYASLFGLSPAARTKVKVNPPDKPEPGSEYFNA